MRTLSLSLASRRRASSLLICFANSLTLRRAADATLRKVAFRLCRCKVPRPRRCSDEHLRGHIPETPALAAQARLSQPQSAVADSFLFYGAYPRTPAPSRAFPILLTQNPGPGRSADADFKPFPCEPSPGVFAAHLLRKLADAPPRR